MNYKVGDKVKVIDNSNSHSYKVGSTVTIYTVEGATLTAIRPDGTLGNILRKKDVVPVSKVKPVAQFVKQMEEKYARPSI